MRQARALNIKHLQTILFVCMGLCHGYQLIFRVASASSPQHVIVNGQPFWRQIEQRLPIGFRATYPECTMDH